MTCQKYNQELSKSAFIKTLLYALVTSIALFRSVAVKCNAPQPVHRSLLLVVKDVTYLMEEKVDQSQGLIALQRVQTVIPMELK